MTQSPSDAPPGPDTPAEIDARILEAMAREDFDAAATLALRGHGPAILRFLYGLLRRDEAVEDAYAQFCEDLWRGLPAFRGHGAGRTCAFRTYAFQLAHNAACRHLKDPYRRRGQRLVTEDLARVAHEVREATATFRRTNVRDRVAHLRSQLAPEEQALLVLRIDQKLGWREVAEVFSSEESPLDAAAARKRFERLKVRLRELAQAEGLLGAGNGD